MVNGTPPLTWLWTAVYADDFVFAEPRDDRGVLTQGSAFTDANYLTKEHGRIVAFILKEIDGPRAIGVDLITGVFGCNGMDLTLGDNDAPHPDTGIELRLVFYRQQRLIKTEGQPEIRKTRYCIGWQATIAGKNVQNVMGVY